MPLKQLRVCKHCNIIRWAGCSTSCRIDREEWVPNLQTGAGTILPGTITPIEPHSATTEGHNQ